MLTSFNKIVWKYWATPKVKFFSWLAIRNRIWMADHPERRGWDNCDLCPLCKQTQETVAHLLSHCRYTKRLLEMLKGYLNISSIKTNKWTTNLSIDEWWSDISCEASPNQKALATLIMLVSWTIWKERNARVKIIKPHRWPFSLRLSRAKQDFGLPWVLSIWVLYHWESNPVGNLFFFVFVFDFVPLNSPSYLMNGGESFATF
jgi:hypothetical protein